MTDFDLVARHLEQTESTVRFTRNDTGRDFVVGDIHGAFSTLEALLDGLSFDKRHDRLFSVGDLVDRSPGSGAALEWTTEYPWFHAVRGNHEQLLLDSDISHEDFASWMQNGGDWWHGQNPSRQARFRERFSRLPFAIEVETATGTVGIVHADIPIGWNWKHTCERLKSGDRQAAFDLLWLRERCKFDPTDTPPDVKGIDRVYCGHTPQKEPTSRGNVHYIDTGAGMRRRLTIVEIHPARHRIHCKKVS